MADTQRVRENSNVRSTNAIVASATVIEIGDMVSNVTAGAASASAFAWDTNIGTTQTAFQNVFLGVATRGSDSGDTEDIRVVTGGAFVEFACASTTWIIGDLVGPADSGSSTLQDQTVVSVATAGLAIGRVAKNYTSATTKVLVEIVGILDGGVQTVI